MATARAVRIAVTPRVPPAAVALLPGRHTAGRPTCPPPRRVSRPICSPPSSSAPRRCSASQRSRSPPVGCCAAAPAWDRTPTAIRWRARSGCCASRQADRAPTDAAPPTSLRARLPSAARRRSPTRPPPSRGRRESPLPATRSHSRRARHRRPRATRRDRRHPLHRGTGTGRQREADRPGARGARSRGRRARRARAWGRTPAARRDPRLSSVGVDGIVVLDISASISAEPTRASHRRSTASPGHDGRTGSSCFRIRPTPRCRPGERRGAEAVRAVFRGAKASVAGRAPATPTKPWTKTFGGGTRISMGLALALDVIRRQRLVGPR